MYFFRWKYAHKNVYKIKYLNIIKYIIIFKKTINSYHTFQFMLVEFIQSVETKISTKGLPLGSWFKDQKNIAQFYQKCPKNVFSPPKRCLNIFFAEHFGLEICQRTCQLFGYRHRAFIWYPWMNTSFIEKTTKTGSRRYEGHDSPAMSF